MFLSSLLSPLSSFLSPRKELIDLLLRGVAHVVNGEVVLLLEEIDLERQNAEELIHVALDAADAAFLPGPYLGRDVVEDFWVLGDG